MSLRRDENTIPIYKAKKRPIDDKKYVLGMLENHATKEDPLFRIDCGDYGFDIDLSTLEISFDNGESFDSINEIADLFCDYTPKEILYKLETNILRNCHNCHYLNGLSCLNDKIPDSDTARYIEFSGCGLHVQVDSNE